MPHSLRNMCHEKIGTAPDAAVNKHVAGICVCIYTCTRNISGVWS